jgi:amidase
LEAEDYRAATARLRRITTERGIGALLDSLELDLLVTPTGGPAWLIDLVNGDHFLGGFSSMAAIEGSPHLSLPMGRVHGLPVGLSLLARRCGDAHLLAAGEAIQALLKEQP